jgi:hypothetical protein
MNFNLNYTPPPSLLRISHNDKILLIGSCFAENIGEKLRHSKFDCLVNPNGILFNPISISKALHSYIHPEKYQLNTGNNNGLYFSYDHHGDLSDPDKEQLTAKIKRSMDEAHQFLKTARILIITFGSAFVYRRIRDAEIVANCHKLPQKEFMKDLLSPEDINSAYTHLINELRDLNPDLKIIFTVSPVKYLRDGIIENNLSKSILIYSVHNKVSATSNPKSTLLNYFPAYELVNDDLRDYRFYKEDMAHPNDQAINYIWEKFSDTYFDEDTKELNEKINDIRKAASHRPIHTDSDAHQQFKRTYLQKCEQLEKEFPGINLEPEKNVFTT